jgi:hypothetical protein
MVRYSFVVLAGLAAAAPASAGWADALFDEHAKDFGSVPRGPSVTHSFRVVNKTGSPVVIGYVHVSCGCTTAHAVKTYLAPGEETAIVARMDTTRFSGARSVTIFVPFNEPAYDEVRLVVSAFGREDLRITPDTLAFGQVKRGSKDTATMTLTFYTFQAVQVTGVRSETNYILTGVKEVRRGNGEVAYEVTARLRGDLPVGKWFTDIWVKTNDPSLPQIRLPLTVEIEPVLIASPEAVTVGEVSLGSETERRVILRGIKPFRIVKIDGVDDAVTVKDNAGEAQEVHVLIVKLKADRAGGLNRKLLIHTDIGAEGDLELPLTARITP